MTAPTIQEPETSHPSAIATSALSLYRVSMNVLSALYALARKTPTKKQKRSTIVAYVRYTNHNPPPRPPAFGRFIVLLATHHPAPGGDVVSVASGCAISGDLALIDRDPWTFCKERGGSRVVTVFL